MTQPFTEANFMKLIVSAEGTPYRLGGIDPFHGGADCSGLIYWAALQCGVTLPRTTTAEWAGLPHNPTWQNAPVGSIIEFDVPADHEAEPAHVGVVIGNGFMIDDPFTGAVVRKEAIPNVPGQIWPLGYCILPFVTPAPPAPPTPNPTPPAVPSVGGNTMFTTDPETGGTWSTDSNGALYAEFGAPFITGGSLNQHPEYHAGSVESGNLNSCVGLAACKDSTGQWGIVYFTYIYNTPGPDGSPYHTYRFSRSGQPD